MVDILSLIRHLEARTPHTESHSIHIDSSRIGLLHCGHSHVRVGVLVEGNEDLHLLTPPFSD